MAKAGLIAALAAFFVQPAIAGNTWDGGGGDDNWSTNANWSGDTQPAYGTITFSGSTRTTNIIDANYSMNIILWSGTSAWTLNQANSAVLSLFDNGGAQAKVENQSTGLVTINAPITFAATAGATFGEINAVSGDMTFGTGTLTVNGSQVAGIKLFGTGGHTINFNNTVSASGKYFAFTETTTTNTINIGGSFTASNFYVMNGGTLNLASGGNLNSTAIRLGGDFGTTGNQDQTKSGTFQLTATAGGQTFSGTINSVSGATGTLSVNSLNTSNTNTLSGSIFLDSDLTISETNAGGTLLLQGGSVDVKARTLTVSGSGNTTINETLSSSLAAGGSLIKSGSGTLILQGTSNNYTGTSAGTLNANGTQISGGTLGIYAALSLGLAPTGAYNNIQFTGTGTLQDTSSDITLGTTRNISIASGATATFDNKGNNFMLQGILNGLGSVNIINSGVGGAVTLSGTNTFTGSLSVSSGTLAIATIADASTNGTLGNSATAVTLGSSGNTGKLEYTGASLSSTRPFAMATSGTGEFQIDTSGTTLTLNGIISGSGNLIKTGAGTLALTNASNSYAGDTTISAGRLSVDADATLGSGAGTLFLSGGALATTATRAVGDVIANNISLAANSSIITTSAATAVLANFTGTLTGTAGTLTIQNVGADGAGDTFTARFSGGTFTMSRPITLTGGTGQVVLTDFNTTGTTHTYNGVISGNGSYSRSATTAGTGGTTVFTANNTYTGTTTAARGTLEISNTNSASSGRISGTSGITVNSTGTLLLSGSSSWTDRINDSATMTLNGGTFNTGGLSEKGSVGIGALTLSSSSIIDMASGASIINFANSSAATWSGTLSIYNWSGTPVTGGGTDQLIFGTDSSGLTGPQLAEIVFYSDAGSTLYGGATTILSTGEVVPVPEPSTWVAGGLAFAALAFTQRRRLKRLLVER